jgi:TonB-dependent SusC/RagA subfamily outer membrane receptor
VIVDGIQIYAQSPTRRDGDNASQGKLFAPQAMDQIDPNSIKTMEVLKGPSATKKYGAGAANGVIVITTKTGTDNNTSGKADPIVIVDGVRLQVDPSASGATKNVLDNIDPATIASIQVLKGPQAVASYGNDAANGAVVIMTKKK